MLLDDERIATVIDFIDRLETGARRRAGDGERLGLVGCRAWTARRKRRLLKRQMVCVDFGIIKRPGAEHDDGGLILEIAQP